MWRVTETTILVDFGKLLRNMVVEAIVHDQKNTDTRWLAVESLFGEGIWVEHTVLHGTDRVLDFLARSI